MFLTRNDLHGEGPAVDHFIAVAEGIPHLVWMTSARGTGIYFNQRLRAYFKGEGKDPTEWDWKALVHPDDLLRTQAAWNHSLRSAEPFEIEYRLRRFDGAYRWHVGRAAPQFDEGGQLVRWLGTCTDVHDRMEARQALARSEERFRLIALATHDAVYDWDLVRDVVWWNEDSHQLFGYAPADIQANSAWWQDRIHPEDRNRTVSEVQRVFARGEKFWAGEYRFLKADGSYAHVADQGYIVCDDQGRAIRMVGAMADVSERRQAEEQLREREKLFAAVITAAGAAPYTRNYVTDQYDYVGPCIEALLGYRPDEFTPALWDSLVLEVLPFGSRWDLPVGEAMAFLKKGEAESWWADVRVRDRWGRERWLFNAAAIVLNEQGNPVASWGLIQDVTERKRLEGELRQAQKMEAVGRLAGGVAHDFNNLLTVINGYADMLLQEIPPESPWRGQLAEILKAGGKAASLTGQLLSFSRKQVTAPKVIDLNEVIRDTEKMLGRILGEDVRLKTALSPNLGSIKADPGQVTQVILNLAANARDAMPEGGQLAIATTEVTSSQGPFVLLTMADTGLGMMPEVRQRLFEPFFTTKPLGEGTGLGLAVVHGIVQECGGHVEVESEPGRGTTLRVFFPRGGGPLRAIEPVSKAARTARGQERILVVEDEEGVRTLACQALQSFGYHVVGAADAEEALRIVDQLPVPVDLLVTDVIMPGLGGRELAERLLVRVPSLKVVYMSGYTEDAVVRHGVRQERVNFLQKPFSPRALAQMVRDVLDAGRRK